MRNRQPPQEIVDEMLNILFINDNKDISELSFRKALDFAKAQESKYQKVLFMGLYIEYRGFNKRQKLEKKRKKLIGEK